MNGKDIQWINCAKFIAIFAVMLDHTYKILYVNRNLALASYFSVSLFVLISGMTCFISCERHNYNWLKTFAKSSKNIVCAYLLATFVYQICSHKFFDFNM